jgi:hypothetical protein
MSCAELRNYLSVPEVGRRYNLGTLTPTMGAFVPTSSGLYVPEGARVDPAPIDFARTYIRLSEVATDQVIPLDEFRLILRHIPLRNALAAISSVMCVLREPAADNSWEKLDRDSLDFFREPVRSRLAAKVAQGSVIHAPQLIMILAKLVLAHCPDVVPDDQVFTVPPPFLLLILADNVDVDQTDFEGRESGFVAQLNDLAVEVAANSYFYSAYREDSELALFWRRWIEMSSEAPSPSLSMTFEEIFQQSTGVTLRDQTAVAIALWAGCTTRKLAVQHLNNFQQNGWARERVESAISLISCPVDRYRTLIEEELSSHGLDWYFTTFARYPVIAFGDELVILDPKLLLRRCIGGLPRFDIESGLKRQGRIIEVNAFRAAFTHYSERYACEVFESLTGSVGVRRVYTDKDLKRAYKDEKVADIAVDYGTAWVVVEVTTSQAARDTVNAVSVGGLRQDIAMIMKEVEQVAATIDHLRQRQEQLIGERRENAVNFYPIIVLTEGYPNNPITTTLVREEAKRRGLLASNDVAPVELMNLGELDMVEGVAETHAPALPEILRLKQRSNFHADSIRNFLVGDPRFEPRRPRRVSRDFRRVFDDAVAVLGGDPTAE